MFCDPISLHTQESNLASQYLQKFCLESRDPTETSFHQNKSTLTQGLVKSKSEVEGQSASPGHLRTRQFWSRIPISTRGQPNNGNPSKIQPMNWLMEVVKQEFSYIIRFPNVGESFAKSQGTSSTWSLMKLRTSAGL